MREPVGTVAALCDRLGMAFDDASAGRGAAVARRQPAGQARRAPLHAGRLRARRRSPACPVRLLLAAVPVIAGERILVTGVDGHDRLGARASTSPPTTTCGGSHASRVRTHGRRRPTPRSRRRRRPTRRSSTARERLEAARASRVRAVDLASGDFGELPDDFTYVVHLAWLRADLDAPRGRVPRQRRGRRPRAPALPEREGRARDVGHGGVLGERRPVVGLRRTRPDRSRRHRVRADEPGVQARPRERRRASARGRSTSRS